MGKARQQDLLWENSMKRLFFILLPFITFLGACAPRVQPICPDAIYNKYGYVQEDCQKSPPGFTLFKIPVSLTSNNLSESLTERSGEPEGGDRVPTPQPRPERPSSGPVSQPEDKPKDTPKEDVQDEPKENPPESKPKEEPKADRPKPDHPRADHGGDKPSHKDRPRQDKDHPKEAKAKGC
jgi:hypothetical protein